MPDNNRETAFVAIIETGLTDADEPISVGIATFEIALPRGVLIRKVDMYYGAS